MEVLQWNARVSLVLLLAGFRPASTREAVLLPPAVESRNCMSFSCMGTENTAPSVHSPLNSWQHWYRRHNGRPNVRYYLGSNGFMVVCSVINCCSIICHYGETLLCLKLPHVSHVRRGKNNVYTSLGYGTFTPISDYTGLTPNTCKSHLTHRPYPEVQFASEPIRTQFVTIIRCHLVSCCCTETVMTHGTVSSRDGPVVSNP